MFDGASPDRGTVFYLSCFAPDTNNEGMVILFGGAHANEPAEDSGLAAIRLSFVG